MAVKITLNRPHMLEWVRWLVVYLIYVALGLIFGWHLKPRMDEFLTVLFLPLAVLIPWIVLSLLVAAVKSLWTIRFKPSLRLGRLARLKSDQ
jgi:hypothetical protein